MESALTVGQVAVHGRAVQPEEPAQFRHGVPAAGVHLAKPVRVGGGEFGLPTPVLSFGFRSSYAFASAFAVHGDLKFGGHAQDLEKHCTDGIGRVVGGAPDGQRCAHVLDLICDAEEVAQRSTKSVELGHHELIALAQLGQCPIEGWPDAAAAADSAVEVDSTGINAEGDQRFSLGLDVLFIGRYPPVSDLHASSVAYDRDISAFSVRHVYATAT